MAKIVKDCHSCTKETRKRCFHVENWPIRCWHGDCTGNSAGDVAGRLGAKMFFEVKLEIPAYNVKTITRVESTNTMYLMENIMNEIALYWIKHNPGNSIDIALEKCDIEFSIKIKPIKQSESH